MKKDEVGKLGEEEAVRFLKKKRYDIIARNWRNKFGEIDIIALDRDTIVFVEVRTKMSGDFGTPQESVTKMKMRQIAKAASIYICEKRLQGESIRFDFIGVIADKNAGKPIITHIENAFSPSEVFLRVL
jgi:putative endonuclease